MNTLGHSKNADIAPLMDSGWTLACNAAARFNARYIPPMQTLCNDDGCLVRVGDMAGDLMQFDDNHFTVAGSKFFVGQIAHQILN